MERKLAANIQILKFDVVIVGTGFAGLEAAYGALSVKGKTSIAIVSLQKGPSGSSFQNHNKRVGIQIPLATEEKEYFIKRAIDIGSPGCVTKELVSILMEDIDERFYEIKKIGIDFLQDKNGNLLKFKGCFLPEKNSAIVISDLNGAYNKLFNRIKDKVTFLREICIFKIFVDKAANKLLGILGYDLSSKTYVAIKTRTLIFCAGGVASLFYDNIAWQHPFSGISLSVLKDAGACLTNEGFIQMLWLNSETLEFVVFNTFKEKNTFIIQGDKKILIPYTDLIEMRNTHCPIAYRKEDSKLDHFLLKIMDKDGLKLKSRHGILNIRPYAQAQNGGAKVDKYAETNVNGIFTCGECASGMHGANRIGGAMILSCLVFGYRAGKYAAKFSKENIFLSDSLFIKLINDFFSKTTLFCNTQDKEHSHLFELSKWLLLGSKTELFRLREEVAESIFREVSYINKLKLKSLQIVIDGRMKVLKRVT